MPTVDGASLKVGFVMAKMTVGTCLMKPTAVSAVFISIADMVSTTVHHLDPVSHSLLKIKVTLNLRFSLDFPLL